MTNIRNDKNAAKNLLAGWALSGCQETLKTKLTKENLKVLVLDDCYSDWKDTYDTIFGQGNHETLENCTQTYFIEQKENHYTEFRTTIKQKIASFDLVIFDLYFTESHGEEYHSNPENIKNVSGYEIYRIVKGFDQSVPLMVFSTSNKIWTFKLFNSMGIDGFSTKNPSPAANEQELKSYFLDFETTLLKLLKPEYKLLRTSFKALNQFKEINHIKYWWYKLVRGNKALKKTHIYESLAMAYLSIRRILSSQHYYEISVQYLDVKIDRLSKQGDGCARHQGINYFVKGVTNADINKTLKIEINTILEDKQMAFAQKVKLQFNDFEFDSFSCSAVVGQLGNISEIVFNTISVSDIDSLKFKYITHLRNYASHSFKSHTFDIDDVFIALRIILYALNSENEALSKSLTISRGNSLKELHHNFYALIKDDVNFDSSIKELILKRSKK